MSVLPDEKIEEIVTKNKLVDSKELSGLVKFAKDSNQPLEEILIEKEVVSDDKLGLALADYYKVPFINLSDIDIPDEVLNLLPDRVMRRQKALVFAKDKSGIKIAMLDPTKRDVVEMIAIKTGVKVTAY